jgi:hypothetical protein
MPGRIEHHTVPWTRLVVSNQWTELDCPPHAFLDVYCDVGMRHHQRLARLVGPDRWLVVVGQSLELDLLVAALTP